MSSIPGTKVLSTIVPLDTADTYATHNPKYGKGGLRTVANEAERTGTLGTQLPMPRREEAMIVFQADNKHFYQLGADLITWTDLGTSLGGGQPIETIIAGSTISALRVITIDSLTNKAIYASNNNLDHISKFVALSITSGILDDSIEIISKGKIEDLMWNWDVSLPIFLGVNGQLTQTPPSYPTNLFRKIIGYAKSPTILNFNPDESIRLA